MMVLFDLILMSKYLYLIANNQLERKQISSSCTSKIFIPSKRQVKKDYELNWKTFSQGEQRCARVRPKAQRIDGACQTIEGGAQEWSGLFLFKQCFQKCRSGFRAQTWFE